MTIRLERTSQCLVVALFGLFLVLPVAGSLLGIQIGSRLQEKRKLAVRPPCPRTRADFIKFPVAYDRYFSGHFGFRDLLVFGYNCLFYYGFNTSPEADVVMGKDRWLFYGADSELTSFRRSNPYSDYDRRYVRQTLGLFKEWSHESGIRLLFVLIPNKSTTYADRMPPCYTRLKNPARADEAVAMVREAGLDIVDLRQVLLQGRDGGEVFWRDDSHWNYRGACIATRAILGHLSHNYPAIKLPPAPGQLAAMPSNRVGDLANMLGIGSVVTDPTEDIIPEPLPFRTVREDGRRHNAVTLYEAALRDTPSVVVYHDSFGTFVMKPFMAGRVRRLKAIRSHRQDYAADEREKADVVIIMFSERMLVQGEGGAIFDRDRLLWHLRRILPASAYYSQTGALVEDTESIYEVVRQADRDAPPGVMLFGHLDHLPAGDYVCAWNMKCLSEGNAAVARLDVATDSGQRILAERTVFADEWEQRGEYRAFTLPFTITNSAGEDVEYRVQYLGGGLSVDSVAFPQQ